MREGASIAVVIPARDEERAIGRVLAALPGWIDQILVVDNGSSDGTATAARGGGAEVVSEARRGYGAACLAGIAALRPCQLVLFLDGDFSDDPGEADRLVDPILQGQADLVVGSRTLGQREPGALTPQARLGNAIACTMIGALLGHRFTDLGPFRAIRSQALAGLAMQDRDYGWTVEMQVKAVARGLRVIEVPVSYRRRIGRSKISGSLRGVLGASLKIPITILRHAARELL